MAALYRPAEARLQTEIGTGRSTQETGSELGSASKRLVDSLGADPALLSDPRVFAVRDVIVMARISRHPDLISIIPTSDLKPDKLSDRYQSVVDVMMQFAGTRCGSPGRVEIDQCPVLLMGASPTLAA